MRKKDVSGPRLEDWVQELLDTGEYEDIDELCNNLGLNYDDVFIYPDDDEDF